MATIRGRRPFVACADASRGTPPEFRKMHPRLSPRTAAILMLAVAPAAFAAAGDSQQQQTGLAPTMSLTGLTSLSQLGKVVVNPAAISANAGRSFSVLPLNAPPVN